MSSIKIATHESENNIAEEPTIVENNNTDNTIEHASTNIETQVIDSGVPNKYTNDYQGVEIKNGTNYTLTDDILNYEGLEINQSDVMIFTLILAKVTHPQKILHMKKVELLELQI